MQNRWRGLLGSLCPLLIGAISLTACKGSGSDDEVASDDTANETSETTSTNETTQSTESDAGSEETGDPSCNTESPESLRECVEGSRYQADLEFIAQPRTPGSPHWQAVQDLCADRFADYGFEVQRMTYGSGVNVIGRKAGTTSPDEEIVIAAHYDHIEACAGADDNATGTAAVLETARVLAQRTYPRTLVVACWDEEESGLTGAEAFVAQAGTENRNILFNYNFEMIGYSNDGPNTQTVPSGLDLLFPTQYAQLESWQFRGDWIALIVDFEGREHASRMADHAAAIGLPFLLLDLQQGIENSPLLADLRRSDHAAFWEQGYAAMMITDTSEFRYQAYHCENGLEDTVDKLDNGFSTKVIQATVSAAAQSLGM